MPGYDMSAGVGSLLDHSMGAALALEEHIQKIGSAPDLAEVLKPIITEMMTWGLEDTRLFDRFSSANKMTCVEILRARDGQQSWRSGTWTFRQIFDEMSAEYQNLKRAMAEDRKADLKKAKEFAQAINKVGIIHAWVRLRKRRLAA